ncbi:MAG: exonuclease domain-containing protein [Patescibacteria group bacterium]|nr:exonuclease domain-containing protein [Patescibacteria group bacterium]
MFGLPKKIVIFDLECTTWEGAAARNWSLPGEHREVIQLGAVLVETEKFIELDSVEFLVRPKINTVLSQYFINLTNIKQKEVDEKGVKFEIFLRNFFEFCSETELYCFDKIDDSRLFDRDVLMENCKLYGIKFPFKMGRFHNINKVFFQHGVKIKQSGAAPKAFGIESAGPHHNALSDARGIVVGLRALGASLNN